MNETKLNLILKLSAGLLALSIIFCVCTIIYTTGPRKDGRQTEEPAGVKVAEVQLPTAVTAEDDAEEEEPAYEAEEIIEAVADALYTVSSGGRVIVLDAGHGKSSSLMPSDEKTAEGYVYNENRGSWGEWRHYKNGSFGDDCHGSGCTLTAPPNGSCWYPMGNGDRDIEPEINLNNAFAAQRYLEEMGYEVRMTRTSNDQNPSMNKRVSYCFPYNDITQTPDAALYVCIHSNAGGGRGTSYISLGGTYCQSFIPADYVTRSNTAGRIINERIAAASGLSGNGPIGSEEYLILFNKSPVPIAYLEIGFYDNSSDKSILESSSDAIGRAIAEGVDEYLSNY